MLLEKRGEKLKINGVTFYIGQRIIANGVCPEYEGLIGYIKQIRTDSDKDTDNEFEDIYISFEVPEDPERIKRLEEDFSDLYDEPKTIDDIILDSVIMAASMLIPQPNIKQLADYVANWYGLLKEELNELNENYDPRDKYEERVIVEQIGVLTDIVSLLDIIQVNDPAIANSEQRYYKVPLIWQMTGKAVVAASSIDEAIKVALGPGTPLPTDAYYLEDSVEVDDIGEIEIYHPNTKGEEKV